MLLKIYACAHALPLRVWHVCPHPTSTWYVHHLTSMTIAHGSSACACPLPRWRQMCLVRHFRLCSISVRSCCVRGRIITLHLTSYVGLRWPCWSALAHGLSGRELVAWVLQVQPLGAAYIRRLTWLTPTSYILQVRLPRNIDDQRSCGWMYAVQSRARSATYLQLTEQAGCLVWPSTWPH